MAGGVACLSAAMFRYTQVPTPRCWPVCNTYQYRVVSTAQKSCVVPTQAAPGVIQQTSRCALGILVGCGHCCLPNQAPNVRRINRTGIRARQQAIPMQDAGGWVTPSTGTLVAPSSRGICLTPPPMWSHCCCHVRWPSCGGRAHCYAFGDAFVRKSCTAL